MEHKGSVGFKEKKKKKKSSVSTRKSSCSKWQDLLHKTIKGTCFDKTKTRNKEKESDVRAVAEVEF